MGIQSKDHRHRSYSPPPPYRQCLTKGLITKIIYLLLPLVFLHFYFFPRPLLSSYYTTDTTTSTTAAIVTVPVNSADDAAAATTTSDADSAVSSTTAAPAPPAPRCDYSRGQWVPSSTPPLYNGSTCSTIKDGQNCMAHGRPDTGYLNWRWQPEGPSSCPLPPFSPSTFLSLLSHRHIAFVGDSMARNQLESLLCLLSSHPTDPPPRLVYSGGDDNKFRRWRLDARDATISIHWSPFLVRGVEKDPASGVNHNELFLDEIHRKWASEISNADIVVLSVGHWFLHPAIFYDNKGSTIVGCHYCPGKSHTEVGFYEVYRKAFRTALHWIIDHQKAGGKRKYVVATTFSPAHFEGEWDKAGACSRKEPYGVGEKEVEGMDKEMWLRQVEEVAAAKVKAEEYGGGKVRFDALDVTRMALLRPDGHPGPYMNPFPFGHDGSSVGTNSDRRVQNDCVHWCLPGPIDAWNEVFLMMVKRWSEEESR